MDAWAEAMPVKEPRLSVQGVVRNTLQYERLYDDAGQFRAEVGSRAGQNAPDKSVRVRRVTGNEDDE
jgi:hypothetical protein